MLDEPCALVAVFDQPKLLTALRSHPTEKVVGLLHRSMYLWVLRDEDEERGGPDDAQLRCCTCVGNVIGY